MERPASRPCPRRSERLGWGRVRICSARRCAAGRRRRRRSQPSRRPGASRRRFHVETLRHGHAAARSCSAGTHSWRRHPGACAHKASCPASCSRSRRDQPGRGFDHRASGGIVARNSMWPVGRMRRSWSAGGLAPRGWRGRARARRARTWRFRCRVRGLARTRAIPTVLAASTSARDRLYGRRARGGCRTCRSAACRETVAHRGCPGYRRGEFAGRSRPRGPDRAASFLTSTLGAPAGDARVHRGAPRRLRPALRAWGAARSPTTRSGVERSRSAAMRPRRSSPV